MGGLRDLYRNAFAIRSFDRSLFTHLLDLLSPSLSTHVLLFDLTCNIDDVDDLFASDLR